MSVLLAVPPIQPFPPLQSVQTTVEANAVVTAYHSAAFWAFPLGSLRFEEDLYAFVPDALQILDLAHSEIGLVPFVNRREGIAGEVPALVTILHLILEKEIALLLEEGTWRLPGSAAFAVPHPYTQAPNIMLGAEISRANVAVHATRSDELLLHAHPKWSLKGIKPPEGSHSKRADAKGFEPLASQ